MSFSIDGLEWDVPCTIERTAEVRASEISGMMLDKNYFNDVVGLYLQYTVTLSFQIIQGSGSSGEQDYYRVWKALTDPVDAHTLVMPHNGGEITVTAKVDTVKDVLVRMPGGTRYWKGIQFTATAVHPSKTYTLAQAISRGLAPLPERGEANIGEIYEYTSSGWQLVEYTNADNVSY